MKRPQKTALSIDVTHLRHFALILHRYLSALRKQAKMMHSPKKMKKDLEESIRPTV